MKKKGDVYRNCWMNVLSTWWEEYYPTLVTSNHNNGYLSVSTVRSVRVNIDNDSIVPGVYENLKGSAASSINKIQINEASLTVCTRKRYSLTVNSHYLPTCPGRLLFLWGSDFLCMQDPTNGTLLTPENIRKPDILVNDQIRRNSRYPLLWSGYPKQMTKWVLSRLQK